MPIARPSDTRPTYFPRERCFSRHPGVFPHLNPEAGQMSHCYPNDRGGKRVTPIDARAGKIAGAIEDLGGRTEHLAADEAGHVFLKMQHIGKLHKLDAQSLKVMETWPLDPLCGQPSSIVMDSIHNRESADKYALVQNVRTLPGARTISLDRKSGAIYLPVADLGPLPPVTAENPRPRAPSIPGTFSVLVVGQ